MYADGYTGCLYLDKPKEVEAFADAFDSIWTTALDEHASRRLVYYLGMPFRRRPGGGERAGRPGGTLGEAEGRSCVCPMKVARGHSLNSSRSRRVTPR